MFRALTLRFSALSCLLSCLFAGLMLAPPAYAARTILVFGDSLSAGYGLRQEAAWPSLLDQRLHEKKLDYTVVNASISGETTSGGRTRLDAALARYAPQIVIIALGGNDGLRGLPLSSMRDNLAAMTAKAQSKKAKVLIVGQRLPPNYGAYATQFQQVYGEVAKASRAALVDFLLEGIATRPELFQDDHLHPTAEAQPRLLDNVWQGLAPLLTGKPVSLTPAPSDGTTSHSTWLPKNGSQVAGYPRGRGEIRESLARLSY